MENRFEHRYHYKTPLLCNAQCRFCCSNARFSLKKYILPRRRIISDLLFIKKMGFASIAIGGGEPTLIENLLDFIRVGNTLGLRVSLISNGILLDPYFMDELFCAGLDELCLSVHSADKYEHDKLVGISGAHDNILKLLSHKNGVGKIQTNTVILKSNQGVLSNIVDLLRPFGIPISFCNLEVNETHTSDYNNKKHLFTDLNTIREQIRKIAQTYSRVSFDNLPLCAFDETFISGGERIITNLNKHQIEKNDIDYQKGEIERISFKMKAPKCRLCKYNTECDGLFPYFKEDDARPFL